VADAVRVIVADDHPLYLEGLVAALTGEPEIDVVGQALDGEAALRLAVELQPDVAVLDIHMPLANGIEVTRRLAEVAPHTKALMLTMLENDESIHGAIKAGATGYLLKGAKRKEIVRAVQTVASGGVVFSGAVADRLLPTAGTEPPARLTPSGITVREREVAELVAAGLTNTAIANRLHLSQKTVRNYVSGIMVKLHAETRADVARRLSVEGR
jgi:DNA-binding NarL/FixJ family response regulator